VALGVLLRRCEETGVTPILDTDMHGYEGVHLGLRGRHQVENAGVAIRLAELLDIPDTAIITGLETTTHPGRLELIQHEPAFLIDGAHNPAGAKSLRDYLNEFAARPLTLVFGAMRDKQLEQMAEILFPCADTLILTTIKNPRSASIERLQEVADRFARGRVLTNESSSAALRIAEAETPPEGLICIAGSLYLVGELRPLILTRS
jgi:dihydrofolate synthase/folylpolyglutamate synthase